MEIKFSELAELLNSIKREVQEVIKKSKAEIGRVVKENDPNEDERIQGIKDASIILIQKIKTSKFYYKLEEAINCEMEKQCTHSFKAPLYYKNMRLYIICAGYIKGIAGEEMLKALEKNSREENIVVGGESYSGSFNVVMRIKDLDDINLLESLEVSRVIYFLCGKEVDLVRLRMVMDYLFLKILSEMFQEIECL